MSMATRRYVLKTCSPLIILDGGKIHPGTFLCNGESVLGPMSAKQMLRVLHEKKKLRVLSVCFDYFLEPEHFHENFDQLLLPQFLKYTYADNKLADEMQKKRPLDIRTLLKLPSGRPFLPGSSLKGALRTGLLYHLITENDDLRNEYRSRVGEILGWQFEITPHVIKEIRKMPSLYSSRIKDLECMQVRTFTSEDKLFTAIESALGKTLNDSQRSNIAGTARITAPHTVSKLDNHLKEGFVESRLKNYRRQDGGNGSNKTLGDLLRCLSAPDVSFPGLGSPGIALIEQTKCVGPIRSSRFGSSRHHKSGIEVIPTGKTSSIFDLQLDEHLFPSAFNPDRWLPADPHDIITASQGFFRALAEFEKGYFSRVDSRIDTSFYDSDFFTDGSLIARVGAFTGIANKSLLLLLSNHGNQSGKKLEKEFMETVAGAKKKEKSYTYENNPPTPKTRWLVSSDGRKWLPPGWCKLELVR